MRLDQAYDSGQDAARCPSSGRPAQQGEGEQAVDPDLDLSERERLDQGIEGEGQAEHDRGT